MGRIPEEAIQLLLPRCASKLAGQQARSVPRGSARNKFARSQSGKRSIPEADYGYVAARKQVFFGWRLHALVRDTGAVVDFGLTPADTSERDVAREMLDHRRGVSVLADQGYSGRSMMCAGIGPVQGLVDGTYWPRGLHTAC